MWQGHDWLSAVEADCEEADSWRLLTSFLAARQQVFSWRWIWAAYPFAYHGHPLLLVDLFLHICLGSCSSRIEGATFPEGKMEASGTNYNSHCCSQSGEYNQYSSPPPLSILDFSYCPLLPILPSMASLVLQFNPHSLRGLNFCHAFSGWGCSTYSLELQLGKYITWAPHLLLPALIV